MISAERPVGAYVIIDISEPVRKYEDITAIKDCIDAIMGNGTNHIALNVTNIDYMHSYFIKILTSTYKKVQTTSGDLCLIGPNEFICNLMKLLNIDDYITVYKTEEIFRQELNLPPLAPNPAI